MTIGYQSVNVFSGVFASAARTPGKVALTEDARSLTYGRLAERIERIAWGCGPATMRR